MTLSLGIGAALAVLAIGVPAPSPDVTAALVGNLGLISATLITVAGTAAFTAKQFRHERTEKAKDRALELKKELLFQGVRGAQEIMSALSSGSALDLEISALTSRFQNGSSDLVTASSVADVRTVSAGRDFVEAAGPALMRIMTKRAPAMVIHSQIAVGQKLLGNQNLEVQRLLNVQRDAIANGETARVQTLRSLIESGRDLADRMSESNDTLYDRLNSEILALSRTIISEVRGLAPLVNKLVAAVRLDVGVDSRESDSFLSAAQVDLDQMESEFDKLLASMKENLQRVGEDH